MALPVLSLVKGESGLVKHLPNTRNTEGFYLFFYYFKFLVVGLWRVTLKCIPIQLLITWSNLNGNKKKKDDKFGLNEVKPGNKGCQCWETIVHLMLVIAVSLMLISIVVQETLPNVMA